MFVKIGKYVMALLTAVIMSASCSGDGALSAALQEAGDNRAELEKVLSHFSDDPLRYEAACFLIRNMPGKHSREGWQIDSLKRRKLQGRMGDDEMARWKGFDYKRDCRMTADLTAISADLLIDNVEKACSIWQARPWHSHYSFGDFCEYVLPYRVGDEPAENWRGMYIKRYGPLMDSILMEMTDVVEVAARIADRLKEEGFDNHADVAVPNFGASYLMQHRVGYCRENCDIASYTMRALGIPVATDFYITSPSYNSRHFWNALIDTTGLAVPFNYTEKRIRRESYPDARRMGKVYRRFFGVRSPKHEGMPVGDVAPIFLDPAVGDVSGQYFLESGPVEVSFDGDPQWGMLAVFDGSGYVAVDVAPVKEGKGEFRYVEDGTLLFPVVMDGVRMREAGWPVLTGAAREFRPDMESMAAVRLTRKYPMMNTARFITDMIGGTMEVFPNRIGTDGIPLHKFTDTISTNRVDIVCDVGKVRGVRYNSPADKPIEVGEMRFYNGKEEIRPVSIYADHELDSIHRRNLALMSDDIWHSFYMSAKGEKLTFDFGKPVDIDRILFVPRNDDNFVREGQDYELFYHDGAKGWRSLGHKRAMADHVDFEGVPGNAVLWLHNHSGGREERCFYMRDGIQIFI